ncbi:MAG TPA: FmdB family zinc ribbon protein [Jiangellaceae bacterium]|nr:FmdB family zinc ribbon protein [Jiangellaceae bacterium]
MPTYQYACTDCGQPLEVVQRFTDDALTTCPNCGGRLRKVFSAVGVVFKGSGFYRNDSRSNGSSATSPSTTTTSPAESSPKKEKAAAASTSAGSTASAGSSSSNSSSSAA